MNAIHIKVSPTNSGFWNGTLLQIRRVVKSKSMCHGPLSKVDFMSKHLHNLSPLGPHHISHPRTFWTNYKFGILKHLDGLLYPQLLWKYNRNVELI